MDCCSTICQDRDSSADKCFCCLQVSLPRGVKRGCCAAVIDFCRPVASRSAADVAQDGL